MRSDRIDPVSADLNQDIPLSPRLRHLYHEAYVEEGFAEADIPAHDAAPCIALFPRSFVDRIARLPGDKRFDFGFRGALSIDRRTARNRAWVRAFARERFTERSYLNATDRRATGLPFIDGRRALGVYDRTFDRSPAERGFVPKRHRRSERAYFDEAYFAVLCASELTLCPAGDAPWSIRFYEAVACGSIPVVASHAHTGRNALEYAIGYRYHLNTDELVYREDWARENQRLFLEHQTLVGRQAG